MALPSYTEWQGGLYAYGNYTNTGTLTSGAGGSYCYARFGTDCTKGGAYGLFGANSTQLSPYYPWLRSPYAGSTAYVWYVNSDSSTLSVINYIAYSYYGVSPSLWLSSTLSATDGSGTYTSPYSLGSLPADLANIPAGGQTLFLCASDKVGNYTTNQGNYNWESTPPTATQTPDTAVPSSGVYAISPTITVSGSDSGGSGLAAVRLAWDTAFSSDSTTSTWLSTSETTTIPSVGSHTLYYQAKDNAGNVSTVGSAVYQLDTEAPTLETTISGGTAGNSGWYLTPPTLTVTAHDSIGGTQDDTRIAAIISDLQAGNYNSSYDLINNPSATAQTTAFASTDGLPRSINLTPAANGVTTAYYYAQNSTPLNSVIGSTTFNVDGSTPHGWLIAPAKTLDQITLQYTISDDFFDQSGGQNIPSAYTSGLAACDLQESVAVYTADGTLGVFSPFTTILSDCGSPEATNSANSTLLTKTLTQSLAPGRVYQYQLNLLDVAGNAAQITLGDSIASSYIPTLKIFNRTQNQSAYPNTAINITGSVTDLDENQTITVSAEIGGVTKSQTFTSPIQDRGFTLTWLGSELPLGVYGNTPGSLGAITIMADDGSESTTMNYQGSIQSRPQATNITNQDITDLYTDTLSRFAGALFFRVGTLPNLKDKTTGQLTFTNPAANDYYCYDDGTQNLNTACINLKANSLSASGATSTQSAQIWYKDIGDQAQGGVKTYPFIIQFYEQPLSLDELRINDGGW